MHLPRWASFTGKIAQISFLGLLVSALSAQVGEVRFHGGFPEDWTHHRIKFNTATLHQHPEIAAHEPRAAIQLYREAAAMLKPNLTTFAKPEFVPTRPHPDWSYTLGTGRVQPGQFPAKWNSNPLLPITSANCTTDFVVFGLNVPGVTGGQASMIAFYNLYSGTGTALCSGLQPKVLFSYNTSTVANSQIRTSPALSLDGKKVAFVETTINNPKTTIFHVLKIPAIGPNNGADTTHSVAVPSGAMSSLTVVGNSSTRSSPWIDYDTDSAYLAADKGSLYKIHPVFTGTPALVTTAPWPILIHLNSVFTSPVLDVNGDIYLGAGNGILYSTNVNSAAPTITTHTVGSGTPNPGILDSPLLDSGTSVFAISSNDATTSHSAVVVQMATTTLTEKARINIGQGSNGGGTINLFDGDFDVNFTTPGSGHFFVCGTASNSTRPTTYMLPFDSNGNLTATGETTTLVSNNTAARCGPVTEFFNQNIGANGTDFLFWSVTQSCIDGVNGCILSLANGVPGPNSPVEGGGASGIIVDNNSTQGQASSIYFSTESGALNAVKLTQQNLN
jgi:hypothetical protein